MLISRADPKRSFLCRLQSLHKKFSELQAMFPFAQATFTVRAGNSMWVFNDTVPDGKAPLCHSLISAGRALNPNADAIVLHPFSVPGSLAFHDRGPWEWWDEEDRSRIGRHCVSLTTKDYPPAELSAYSSKPQDSTSVQVEAESWTTTWETMGLPALFDDLHAYFDASSLSHGALPGPDASSMPSLAAAPDAVMAPTVDDQAHSTGENSSNRSDALPALRAAALRAALGPAVEPGEGDTVRNDIVSQHAAPVANMVVWPSLMAKKPRAILPKPVAGLKRSQSDAGVDSESSSGRRDDAGAKKVKLT